MGNGFVHAAADETGPAATAHRPNAAVLTLPINRTIIGWVVR